jgi:pantoate--beta-alanine ligase
MKLIDDLVQWHEVRRSSAQPLGFVATMGALHAGHGSLIRQSVAQCAATVVSIFVNPTQFNDPKDLANYPDTMQADLDMAQSLGADYVLRPSYNDLYGDDFRYQIREQTLSRELCGAHRDGHFTGVLTVVMKLLNIVRPQRAYFGEKDYQQYLLIRDMCAAFFMDVEIVPCPTVREEDGLALSSRNVLLDEPGRRIAPMLNKLINTGCSDSQISTQLNEAGFCVDYVVTMGARRFAAATLRCGDQSVRLIDNVPVAVATATAAAS